MALTFPSSPTNGQIYTDTATGNRYVYDSAKSIWKFSANNVGMSVSSTPPANVASGSLWFNRELGRTFIYYNDGDSSQWVETVPAGSIDTNTIASYTNPIFALTNGAYTTANVGFSVANAAFGLANTRFANTSNASFSSSFNVPNGSVSIGTNTFPVGKFHVLTANGEVSRFTATGAGGGYHVSYFDNSTPWYFGSARAVLAGNINDLCLISGFGTTNNLLLGSSGAERMRITSSGDVNIGGITDAGNTLRYFDIYNTNTGGAAGAIMRLISMNSTNTTTAVVNFVKYKTGQFTIDNTDTSGFITINNAGAERMRIDSFGVLSFNSGYGSTAPAYGIRAWVNYQAQATVGIRASQGVSSITKNATGDYTVNLNFTMPDVNYSYIVGISSYVGGTTLGATPMLNSTIGNAEVAPTTTTFRFATCVWNAGNAGQDAKYLNIIVTR